MKKMNVTTGAGAGPTSIGGMPIDGEATAGEVGSRYEGTLVERDNKATTRNQYTGRTPLLVQDLPTARTTGRKTGRM